MLLVSVQNRYMVCAKHVIGSEIVFDALDGCMVYAKRTIAQKSFWRHPMVLLGYEAQLEYHFSLFRDSANLDTR
jgi:hypothetical protein